MAKKIIVKRNVRLRKNSLMAQMYEVAKDVADRYNNDNLDDFKVCMLTEWQIERPDLFPKTSWGEEDPRHDINAAWENANLRAYDLMDSLIERGAIVEVEEKPIDTTVTDEDMEKGVAEFLAWQIEQVLMGRISVDEI